MEAIERTFNGHGVRIMEMDGNPWFVAKDVCDVLELRNMHSSLALLADDEKMTLHTVDSHSGARGGAQLQTLVSESGLYRLIFRSRKSEAENFRRWVFHDVLPSIRKHGAYIAPNADMERLSGVMSRLCDRITALVEDNMAMRAQNEYLRQYEPASDYGSPSPANGLPRRQYRRGAYVSKCGRRPRRPASERQPDLFLDWPALLEAQDAAAQFLASCPQLDAPFNSDGIISHSSR